MVALFYSSQLSVVGSIAHSIGILCTIFRLVYRSWMRHFFWEDAWAAFALIADVVCLACIWLDWEISSWTLIVAFTSALWGARMSIIFSIIHVANHSGSKVHIRITYLIAASFACMWAALVAQKINRCQFHGCQMTQSVALSQLITDITADVSLVATPLYFWKNVGLSHSRKILVLSAFGASLLITAVTIPHFITLSKNYTTTSLILEHVTVALSLVICNLLVIVTSLYHVCSKETFDLDQSFTSNGVFTTIVVAQMYSSTNPETSVSVQVQERTTSRQITTVQTGATQPKDEDANMRHAEEGIRTEGGETSKDGE
ncbi:uncharacterized protein EDB91DRAFT_330879 [Suillus paluster]|uniref:uncharacterized protein n=1 Tax=Suillus paluster TaxID=48578 RepID=UPI001B861568|nr:uncharacterized protein EDB91DRAFT_330879 [Suillus paluster]KAG1741473.1 hypothetical protein EDB91DRAFT_330879 [Suillus paluster]